MALIQSLLSGLGSAGGAALAGKLGGGAIGGPLGGVVGGGIGSLLSSLLGGDSQEGNAQSFFTGTPSKVEQISSLNPEQQRLVSQLLPQLGASIGQPTSFEPFAQQARQRFQEQTLPSIAERFTAAGAGRSSAAQQSALGAGAGLESMLAGQEAQFGQAQRGQDISALLNLLQIGRPEQVVSPGSTGIAAPLLGALGTLGAAHISSGGSSIEDGISSLLSLLGFNQQQDQMGQQVSPASTQALMQTPFAQQMSKRLGIGS